MQLCAYARDCERRRYLVKFDKLRAVTKFVYFFKHNTVLQLLML